MPVFTGNRFGFGRGAAAAAPPPGLPDPTIFPTSPTNFLFFTAGWDGAPADLPLSHANSTWTAPGSQPQGYIRVIVVGGSGGGFNSGGGGGSGYTDGSVTVVSTMQGGSTGNAKVVIRVVT